MLLALRGRQTQEGLRSGTAYAPPAAPKPFNVVTAPGVFTAGRWAPGRPGATNDLSSRTPPNPRWPIPSLPANAQPIIAPPPLRYHATAGLRNAVPGQTLDASLYRPFWPATSPIRLNGLLLSLAGAPIFKRGDPVPVPGHSTPGQFIEWISGAIFPAQVRGLRVWHSGAVIELCLVATADAPSGMGGTPRILKNGTTYAIYLVETPDTNATPVRLNTSAGVKSIRRYT